MLLASHGIRQVLAVPWGLASSQAAKSLHANTVHVSVYYFCGKSHLCITLLWRMSKNKKGSLGK